jgi:hypothetical protein
MSKKYAFSVILKDVNAIPEDIHNPKIRPNPFMAHIFLIPPFPKALPTISSKSTHGTKNTKAVIK